MAWLALCVVAGISFVAGYVTDAAIRSRRYNRQIRDEVRQVGEVTTMLRKALAVTELQLRTLDARQAEDHRQMQRAAANAISGGAKASGVITGLQKRVGYLEVRLVALRHALAVDAPDEQPEEHCSSGQAQAMAGANDGGGDDAGMADGSDVRTLDEGGAPDARDKPPAETSH